MRSRIFSRIIYFLKSVMIAMMATAALPAWAQYPSKPIHIVVTYLAGGSADTLARIVAHKLAEDWGQPVIVENRAGAAGNVGADFVAKAPPDGYTVMFTPPSPLGINWLLYKDMPFDPRTAFTPISVLGAMPNILIVGPRVPSKNIGEFIAYAKAHPGKLNYGSQGVGSTPHLTGAMLALAAGIDIVHIPYKGFPPILTDLMASRLDFAFSDASNVLPRLKDGRIRVLAVASEKRFFALPDTPTLIEAGFPNFVSTTWMSFAGPAGMPVEIVRKWHEELQKIVKMPDVQARFTKLGFEAQASSSEEMRQQMEDDLNRWGEVIKRTGVRNQ